jgi:hypothetical protein
VWDGMQFHHQKTKLSALVNGTMDFYMFHMVSRLIV